jgi:hypothetical protein
MVYNLSPTCFSPSWDIIKLLQGIKIGICIYIELHTSKKHFNVYVFEFYLSECFVDKCSFVPFIHFTL